MDVVDDSSMKQSINIADALDNSFWSPYQKLVTAVAAVALIFDGFDIQILGFAIPSLMHDWQVPRGAFGPVLAVGLAGMAIGGPLLGYCGDRFGRRVSLIFCVAIFGVATIGTAFVHGFFGLTALRVLTGIGTGGALPNVSALVAEFAPLRRRASAVKLTILCLPLGGMLGGLLAAWVLPKFGWRGLYAVGGSFPLVFAAIMLVALPESPMFLARQSGKWEQLTRLLNRMGHSIPLGSSFADSTGCREPQERSLRSLFAPALARETVGLWIAFFFCLGSIYLVFGWLPTMLTTQGLNIATASTGLAAYNFGGVIGILIWAVLVPILGSRGPMLSGSLACAVSALALLLVPIQVHGEHWLLIFCLGINGLLANAVQTSMYALAAHVYPTSIRATGVAYSSAMGRTGGLLASLFGSHIIQAGPAAYWESLAVAMVIAAGGLAWVRSHYPAIKDLAPSSKIAATV